MPASYISSATLNCSNNTIVLSFVGDKYKFDTFRIINPSTGLMVKLKKVSNTEHIIPVSVPSYVYHLVSDTTNEIVHWVEIQCSCSGKYNTISHTLVDRDSRNCCAYYAGYSSGTNILRYIKHFKCDSTDYIYTDNAAWGKQVICQDYEPFSDLILYELSPYNGCILNKVQSTAFYQEKLAGGYLAKRGYDIHYDCQNGLQYNDKCSLYACHPLPPVGTKMSNGTYTFLFHTAKDWKCLYGTIEKTISIRCATETIQPLCDMSEYISVNQEQNPEDFCFDQIITPLGQKGKTFYKVEFFVRDSQCEYDEESGRLLPAKTTPYWDNSFNQIVNLTYGLPVIVKTPLSKNILPYPKTMVMKITSLSSEFICSSEYCISPCALPIINSSEDLKAPNLKFSDHILTIENPLSNGDILVKIENTTLLVLAGRSANYGYSENPRFISYSYGPASKQGDFISITTGVPWTSGTE